MGGSAFLRVPNAWPDVYLPCPRHLAWPYPKIGHSGLSPSLGKSAVCSASPGLGRAVLDHLLWSSPVPLVSAAEGFILGADSSF